MKAIDLVEAMGRIDDSIVLEVIDRMNKNNTVKIKSLRTILIAAALVFALSVTAFAVSSFHQQRKQELKEQLLVEQNNVSSYVEYEQEQESGVTLLSAITSGNFQEVYVNVTPVSEEQARNCIGDDALLWSIDGGKSGGFPSVPFDVNKLTDADLVTVHNEELGTTFQTYDIERIREVAMAESYDAESKTLTLKLSIPSDQLKEKNEVEIGIYFFNEEEGANSCLGTVMFKPTKLEMREIRFEKPVEFKNETSGEAGQIVGMRLSATGMAWLIDIPGAGEFANGNADTEEKRDRLVSWLGAVDDTLFGAKLIFADGSEKEVYAGESLPYENGLLLGEASWSGSIDINNCTAVEILGNTVEFK